MTEIQREVIRHLKHLEAEMGVFYFVLRRIQTEDSQQEMDKFLLENPKATVRDIMDKAFEICDIP